jgi:aminoglycoside/choline kinase family phosphotransferase
MSISNLQMPLMPGGLSAGWLTEVLHAVGLLPASTVVTSVERQQVGEGVGMMSELSRLVVQYSAPDSNLPTSFIAKYPSQNATNREVAMSFNLYEREVRYFAELEPLTSAVSPRAFVKLLQGDNFLLLLEDLGEYRTGNQIEGANLAETEAGVVTLAKLHGAFWERVEQIDWVPHIAGSYHADNMKTLLPVGWPNMVDIFADYIDADVVGMQSLFAQALPGLQAHMDSAPVTLLHGDYRMENFLFGTQPHHHAIAIIDWQGPLLGKGMVDVALLLGQSTKTDVRRQHERALIRLYVDELNALGVAYDVADAWADYRAALLYNWCYAAVVSGTLDASNQRAFAWMSQMIARQTAATKDHNLLEMLVEYIA